MKPSIFHSFPINAPGEKVFEAVSTPSGLNAWWTLTCIGDASEGADYSLGFGPEYQWKAIVTEFIPGVQFELTVIEAMSDWIGARIHFDLKAGESGTELRFAHFGWPEISDHYKVSNYCWAMYLRLLKRYCEHGEIVPWDKRLDV